LEGKAVKSQGFEEFAAKHSKFRLPIGAPKKQKMTTHAGESAALEEKKKK
jgi:hypothetical protein